MPIPAPVFTILGLILIWVVLSLSMRGVLRELRAHAKNKPLRPVNLTVKPRDDFAETVHGYPAMLKVLIAISGLFLLALPYISAVLGENLSIGAYVMFFCFACLIFAILAYVLRYLVTINRDGVTIRAYGTRRIAFSDMTNTKLIRTKAGQQLMVTLRNGKVIYFGSSLTGFQTLLDAVTEHAPLKMD